MKKPAVKLVTVVVLAGICVFNSRMTCGQILPTEESLKQSAQASEDIVNAFMQQSMPTRLSYEYSGSFLTENDRKKLFELAKKSSARAESILLEQKKQLATIEEYEGQDWDKLFGETGLWRQAFANTQTSMWLKCRIDYFAALAANGKDKAQILNEIVRICKSGEPVFSGAEGQLLKVQALELTGLKTNQAYEPILTRPDLTERAFIQATLLKLKNNSKSDSEEIKKLWHRLSQSEFSDDFELNVQAAFLQCRNGRGEILTDIVEKWPASENRLFRAF